MQILPFVLSEQKLEKGIGFPNVVEKSKDFLKMSVSGIDTSYSYSAYFTLSWENNKVYSIPMSNGECVIDEYITTIPENPSDYYDYKVSVSVVGVGADGSRSTSNFVDIILGKSNYSGETTNTPEIPQSQYELFVEAVANSASKAEESVSIVETAEQSCFLLQEHAAGAASRAESAVGQAAAQAEMAMRHATNAEVYADAASNAWASAAEAQTNVEKAKDDVFSAKDTTQEYKENAENSAEISHDNRMAAEGAANAAQVYYNEAFKEAKSAASSALSAEESAIAANEYAETAQNAVEEIENFITLGKESISLIDGVTGHLWKLYVSNGKLTMEVQ